MIHSNDLIERFSCRAFSHLPDNQYENVCQHSTKCLEEFFHQSTNEHRIQLISMLNYLIENFPFGLSCIFKMKNLSLFEKNLSSEFRDFVLVSDQLIKIGEELWSDIQ